MNERLGLARWCTGPKTGSHEHLTSYFLTPLLPITARRGWRPGVVGIERGQALQPNITLLFLEWTGSGSGAHEPKKTDQLDAQG
ncbi:MAG: hypothetical protein ABGY29_05845 [bacterium]